jgi:hypothetical protein
MISRTCKSGDRAITTAQAAAVMPSAVEAIKPPSDGDALKNWSRSPPTTGGGAPAQPTAGYRNASCSSGIRTTRMKRLWSPVVATGGNRWQMPSPENGKEGVGGSSPPEGSAKALQSGSIPVQVDLQMFQCAVDMKPSMELSGSGSAVDRRKNGSPRKSQVQILPPLWKISPTASRGGRGFSWAETSSGVSTASIRSLRFSLS